MNRDGHLVTGGDGVDRELGAGVDVAAHEGGQARRSGRSWGLPPRPGRGPAPRPSPRGGCPTRCSGQWRGRAGRRRRRSCRPRRRSGAKRPSSSKTLVQRLKRTPVTWPFCARTSAGPQPHDRRTPSLSASATSSLEAGMMSRASRQSMSTLSAPRRAAVRATSSMATLPPPTTTTLPLTGWATPPSSCISATLRRKSTATVTPSASSPGMLARRPWQPMAT